MFYKIYKRRGVSSFLAIKNFARDNQIKKIGHAGTLDPLAEGLLLVATNDDTKALSLISNETKEYEVTATLNKFSESYDEGTEIYDIACPIVITKDKLLEALKTIKEQKYQIPPIFSAKKVNGVRSYKLARSNQNISLKPCKIEILSLELTYFDQKNQTFAIKTTVSKGTYIRSLIHDIGKLLKTDAIVNSLKRTKIGNLEINSDISYEKINDLELLFSLPVISIKNNDLISIYKNKKLIVNNELSKFKEAIFCYENEVIGWANNENDKFNFKKIFFNRIEKILTKEK
ncbi:tRNA pseudouridine(55) synthase [Metamycoplasma equirhinis]|uniref:tRNA pseudouridine(55) synthase n=1 Tax=Metamycoplasma equirhinis TaxID=92402 RepID=A0ABZ0P9S4_9BACT|nr:tRNA pseudouridine(55) synthase [Metamycoplasma equirhinis]TPD98748.1 tRNA pseudouridine(55) synthase [Metamycoplasma equirhinis]WPB53724.1 tRNA pseudouridine(55) synthase [Metamycoplasma equirhinis]